jgi:hypothetical protein
MEFERKWFQENDSKQKLSSIRYSKEGLKVESVPTPSKVYLVKLARCTNVSNLVYFWNDTLHVSDGLSVHHQEFKTVHTVTGICQTATAVCLLAGTR